MVGGAGGAAVGQSRLEGAKVSCGHSRDVCRDCGALVVAGEPRRPESRSIIVVVVAVAVDSLRCRLAVVVVVVDALLSR